MKLKFKTNHRLLNGKIVPVGTLVDAAELDPVEMASITKHGVAEMFFDPTEHPDFDRIVGAIEADNTLLDRLKERYGRSLPTINEIVVAVETEPELLDQIKDYYSLSDASAPFTPTATAAEVLDKPAGKAAK